MVVDEGVASDAFAYASAWAMGGCSFVNGTAIATETTTTVELRCTGAGHWWANCESVYTHTHTQSGVKQCARGWMQSDRIACAVTSPVRARLCVCEHKKH